MSLHEQTLHNFIHLLQTQPSLFLPKDRAELDHLIADQTDDTKQLSNAISTWCESHPEIDQALFDLESSGRAPGTKKTGNVPPPDITLNKQTLRNAIQQSFPPSSPPPSTSKS
jgi:hypothetical protein